MTQLNSPVKSKINWTAGLSAIGNIGIVMWVPQEYQTDAAIILNVVIVPGLIITFRTWFTEKKA